MMHKFIAKKHWSAAVTPMGEAAASFNNLMDLINLSLGDPDLNTDSEIIKAAFMDAENGHTHYTDSIGEIELREKICRYFHSKYNSNIEPAEIMVTVGACHGMYLALQAILDPGDEVIIHEPYFTPYYEQIVLSGGKPVILETCEKEGFQISDKKLRNMITSKTKAILINSPNNPTGAVFSIDTLNKIARIAIENDILVISDEVYDAYCFNSKFIPLMNIDGMKERTITLQSFSKDFAMTGWRIGYAVAPSYIIECMRNINEGICFSAPSISQRAAIHALENADRVQEFLVGEFKKRMIYASERINSIKGLSVRKPEGSIYLFVNIKNTGLTSSEFSRLLLEDANVSVIPGTAFGKSGEGYVRIACTVGIDKLKEAFDRIENLLEKS